ncbi:uncharacterized protein LOC109608797 [Aethina tumida]|uniref:uncharacterized protein LOC109608797 n=1 Tax=Aethina tumida TaxID=116153 RepID=UPI00096B0061|nr:uncharacterized protein LOC109608797 [Aethina tumida]
MDRKMMYAFRGWIAFVAFMDFGTAIRSYIEKRSFLSKTILEPSEYVDEEYTTSRILGMYSILKSLALIHCTLFIHYKPIVSMGICSLVITIILYLSETLFFRSATLNFYVVFPCILNMVTLFGLVYLPIKAKLWDPGTDDDENAHLLRQAGALRKRRTRKNN